ncbi:hypothetical protein BJY21_002619 [Kineosphaera limosa]|uniref:Uncharacterized protein n=1 Tax=Kineosphaera limosa NBRC 100340 TaxID=1184609 RepID=K6WMZ0_9MICO|nr:hypothetical protein [Kineosphaera limosa]NYE01435.1 hypothetical protein [Kineosphaera limosa]GAB95181.1 hypothetical protein KILIM_017_00260 [Kineosphaera limosa NBRC 100340]
MPTDSSDARKESPHTTDIPDPHGEPAFGAQPQPEGKAVATSNDRRDDPITGQPLYTDDSPDVSSGGDVNRHPGDKGIQEETKARAVGQPSSTPRREKPLREF